MNRNTDNMVQVTNFVTTFRVDVSIREDWTGGSVNLSCKISVLIEGASFRPIWKLPSNDSPLTECSVFWAEVYAVDKAAQMI